MPRILFIAAHRPDRSPSQRFRFEQYLDFLRSSGYDCDFSWLLDEADDKLFYRPGHYWQKLDLLRRTWRKRRNDVRKAGAYDIIFVQREAFMTGSTRFEKAFKASGAKLVFDFDDAIWNLDISEANKKFSFLKNPAKTSKIIEMADLVIAGNAYLADYARPYNSQIKIIPTTIDTESYRRIPRTADPDRFTIGWSGSLTTIKHFEYALPFLKILREKYGERMQVKVIGDPDYSNEALGIRGIGWNKHSELEELSSFDIGIMPLPDDEWTKGKCGLKGLQYMALEIPTVMSPVGVNSDIITQGKDGFLTRETGEWVEYITRLIENPELRERMGKAARQTVIERYSVLSQQEVYLQSFNTLLNR